MDALNARTATTEKEYTIVGTVTVEKPDKWSVTRGLPTFSVYGFSPIEAFWKAKDIITASWSGPSKVTFHLGMNDPDGNYWGANEDGLDDRWL